MRKGIAIAALAAAVTTAALGRGHARARGRDRVQPPRGAADRGRPRGGHHGRLRVPEPGPSNTVTVLANVIPGEDPAAGPNWYTFSPTLGTT